MPRKKTPRAEKTRRSDWLLGPAIVYLGILAAILMVGLFASVFVTGRDPGVDIVSHVIVFIVSVGLTYLHLTRYKKEKNFLHSVGIKRENLGKSVVWTFALFVVFSLVSYIYWSGANAVMGRDPQAGISTYFVGMPNWYYSYLIFAFFIFVALSEELVFRGFMMKELLVKGPIVAILLSSTLFTSLHLWYAGFGWDSVPLFGGLFMLSVYWAIVAYKTGNICGIILFHGLYNVSSVVLANLFGSSVSAAVDSGVFIFSVACLGYLIYKWLGGMFTEIELIVKGKSKIPP